MESVLETTDPSEYEQKVKTAVDSDETYYLKATDSDSDVAFWILEYTNEKIKIQDMLTGETHSLTWEDAISGYVVVAPKNGVDETGNTTQR